MRHFTPTMVVEDAATGGNTFEKFISVYGEAVHKQILLGQRMTEERLFGNPVEALKLRDRIDAIEVKKQEATNLMYDAMNDLIAAYEEARVSGGVMSCECEDDDDCDCSEEA